MADEKQKKPQQQGKKGEGKAKGKPAEAAIEVKGDGKPKRVFVTHGDPDAAEAFGVRIRAMGLEAHLPTYLETVPLR